MVVTGDDASYTSRLAWLARADVDGRFRDSLVDPMQTTLMVIGCVLALRRVAPRGHRSAAAYRRDRRRAGVVVADGHLPRGTRALRRTRRRGRIPGVPRRRHPRARRGVPRDRPLDPGVGDRSGARRDRPAAPRRRGVGDPLRVQHSARLLRHGRHPRRGTGQPDVRSALHGRVVLAGMLAARDPVRGRRWGIALLAVTFVVLAAPFFGQSFGAALATAPAFALFAWLVSGRSVPRAPRVRAGVRGDPERSGRRVRRPPSSEQQPDPHRPLLPAGRGPGLGRLLHGHPPEARRELRQLLGAPVGGADDRRRGDPRVAAPAAAGCGSGSPGPRMRGAPPCGRSGYCWCSGTPSRTPASRCPR